MVIIVEEDVAMRRRLLTATLGQAARSERLDEAAAALPAQPAIIVAGPSAAQAPPDLIADLGADRWVVLITLGWAAETPTDRMISLGEGASSGELIEAIGRARSMFTARQRIGLEPGKIVTVVSPKGGSGKTALAINLAAALARRSGGPTALVDADLAFGDVAVSLGLNPLHDVCDAMVAAVDGGLDREQLARMLVRHRPSDLLVLAGAGEPARASDHGSPDELVAGIRMLAHMCDHVVVDTSASFDDVSVALARAADEVIVMAGLDLSGVKNAKLGLQVLSHMNVSDSRTHLVINRSDSQVSLDCDEVERALGRKAAVRIPSRVDVPISMNRGIPLVVSDPAGEVPQAFDRLATIVDSDRAGSVDQAN